MTSLNLTDRFVLLYNFTITIHLFASAHLIDQWLVLLIPHLLLFMIIPLLASHDTRNSTSPLHWLHIWYPLLLVIWFYPETGILRHTIFSKDLDPYLLRWETALFPQRFYFTTPLSLNVVTLEFLHGVYFSYYFILIIPGLLALKNHSKRVKEFIFILMISFFVHFWIFIIFPTNGPTPLRSELMPKGILFIPLMNFIYASLDKGGGAFPSTHAAATLISGWFGSQFFPQFKHLLFLWVALILISTVICSYHYTIDTIAGIMTGILFLIWGRKLYVRLN